MRGIAWLTSGAVLVAAASATPRAAQADALTAEQAIKTAVTKVEAAEFEQALDLLRAAEQLTADRFMLARIYREVGVVQEILKRPDDAISWFYRSVRCDKDSTLSAETHKTSAVRLFAIARALATADPDADALTTKTSYTLGADRKICAPLSIGPGSPQLTQEARASSTVGPWIATGVAAVAVGTGIALVVVAAAKDSDCQAILDPAEYATCDRDAVDLERNASFVLGAGIGTAAVATALWIVHALE